MTQSPSRPVPPLSSARQVGDLLFVSGQLPRGADGEIVDGDIVVQTRRSLANLQAVLAAHGAHASDVVKVTAWLTDPSHVSGFNAAYRETFKPPYPARSVVISGLIAGDVEIEAIAQHPRRPATARD